MAAPTEEIAVPTKNLRVEAPIDRTFSRFVGQMETRWPATHHIASQPFESIFVEPLVGGRWYERTPKATSVIGAK